MSVSISAYEGDSAPLRRLFTELLDPQRAGVLKAATDGLEAIDKDTFD